MLIAWIIGDETTYPCKIKMQIRKLYIWSSVHTILLQPHEILRKKNPQISFTPTIPSDCSETQWWYLYFIYTTCMHRIYQISPSISSAHFKLAHVTDRLWNAISALFLTIPLFAHIVGDIFVAVLKHTWITATGHPLVPQIIPVFPIPIISILAGFLLLPQAAHNLQGWMGTLTTLVF
jgi:hypothetical protein